MTLETMTGTKTGKLGALRASPFGARGGVLVLAAFTIVNGSNFLFHVLISRVLGPSAYGALGALLGFLLVFAVPAGALQVAIAKEVAARRKGDEILPLVMGPLLAEAVIWGLAGMAVLAVAAPLLRSLLHLPSLTSALLLAAYVFPVTIGLVPKAVMIGESRFRLLAVALVAGAASRLALAVLFAHLGGGVEGAMAATVLGEIITAGILLPSLRAFVEPTEGVEPIRIRWRDGSAAMSAFTGFWLLASIDVLLARHYLSRTDSGFYAAASTAAKTAMFLPGAVSIVAFPRFAEAGGKGPHARATLLQALAAVGALSIFALAAVLVAPNLVIRVLFGGQYRVSSFVLGDLTVAAAFLGLVSVFMHYLIAGASRLAASLTWAGVVTAVISVGFLHNSIQTVALVMLGTTGMVVISMAWISFASDREIVTTASDFVSRELWDLPEADRDVTVVVPYYNPGPRLISNVQRLMAALDSSGSSFEVIAVSDGSTDGSDEALESMTSEVFRCVRLPVNSGKGQALRTGLAMGRGRYLGFIDADGDLDPILIVPFLAIVRLYAPDVVLGSKRHPMSEVDYPTIRRIYSWGYQQFIRLLFHLNIRDTQTGLKLIRRDVLARSLPRMLEKRFAFDLELFVVARHLGFRKFFDAPVRINHQFTSTVSLQSVKGMLLDTLAIFYRLRILRYYDRPHRMEPPITASGPPTHPGNVVRAAGE